MLAFQRTLAQRPGGAGTAAEPTIHAESCAQLVSPNTYIFGLEASSAESQQLRKAESAFAFAKGSSESTKDAQSASMP